MPARSRLSFASLDLKDVVRDVRSQIEPMAVQQNLDLAVQLQAEQLTVVGDRGALRRMLLVLLDNAVRFTSAPGRVELRVKGVENQVVLEFEDTGIGISDGGPFANF
jgi:signal transduction histidine kinase